jgi:hypothetical protein
MIKSNLSYFAVLGLTFFCNQAFAEIQILGQVHLSSELNRHKGINLPDNLLLSRVRLDILSDISSKWLFGIRLEKAHGSDRNHIEVNRAYASWQMMPNTLLTLGKANHLCVNGGEQRHDPNISRINILLKDFERDDVGLSIQGTINRLGYQVGVVSVRALQEALNYKCSFGSRVHFTPIEKGQTTLGLGAGYIYMNNKDRPMTMTATAANYNRFEGWTVDLSGVFDKLAFSAAYYNRRDKSDNDTFGPEAQSNSYRAQLSYLLLGQGYALSNGMISGPKFESTAFEVGILFTRSTCNGAGIILSQNSDPLSFLSTSTQNIQATSQEVHNIYSVFANYHFNTNTVLKFEYIEDHPKANGQDIMPNIDAAPLVVPSNTTLLKTRRLSMRGEYCF